MEGLCGRIAKRGSLVFTGLVGLWKRKINQLELEMASKEYYTQTER